MNVLCGESIQSVIYRAHILNGIRDFSNVINFSGAWIEFPRVKVGTLDIYRIIGERVVLSMLKRQRLVAHSGHQFSSPAPYRKGLAYFFRDPGWINRRIKGSFIIAFCTECIKSDLHDIGFCYFRFDWMKFTQCKVHNVPLRFIPKKSRKDSLLYLDMIFRGEIPSECDDINLLKYNNFYPYPEERIRKRLYLSECLQDDFSNFIRYQNVIERLKDSIQSTDIVISNLIKFNTAANTFDAIRKSKLGFLKKFIEMHAEIKIFKTGVLHETSILETVLKSNRQDCSLCNHLSCLSNTTVIWYRKMDLTRSCEIAQNGMQLGLMKRYYLTKDEAKQAIADMDIKEKMDVFFKEIGWRIPAFSSNYLYYKDWKPLEDYLKTVQLG